MAADVAEVVFYNEDAATPVTVSKPAGFGAGQALIFVIGCDGGVLSALTAAAGWTQEENPVDIAIQKCKVWTHVFDGTEPATWDFGYDSGSDIAAALIRVTGADVTTPAFVVVANTITSNGASFDSSSVTPTGSDDLLITCLTLAGGGSALSETDPSGMTDLGQTQFGSAFQALAVAKELLASSAPTGVRTWTSISPTGKSAGAFTIAVKSAAGAAAQPPPRLPQIPPHLFRAILEAYANRGPLQAAAQAASGAAKADGRTETTAGVRKQTAAGAVTSARTSVAATGQRGAVGAGQPTARTATGSAGARVQPSGAASASARSAVTATGVKGAAAGAQAPNRTSTTDTVRKQGLGAGVPTARTSTASGIRKQAAGVGAPTARTATQGATAAVVGGAGNPQARTATASAGNAARGGAATPRNRTATTATGKSVLGGATRPSARTVVLATGLRGSGGAARAQARTLAAATGHAGAAAENPPINTIARLGGSTTRTPHTGYAQAGTLGGSTTRTPNIGSAQTARLGGVKAGD
jgi:hypothetical protein